MDDYSDHWVRSPITKALASITKLEQTDDEIKASVSQEVTDRSNAIATEVTNRNAAIDVKEKAITSNEAETYTTKSDFNALQIGGTNLVPASVYGDITHKSTLDINAYGRGGDRKSVV